MSQTEVQNTKLNPLILEQLEKMNVSPWDARLRIVSSDEVMIENSCTTEADIVWKLKKPSKQIIIWKPSES